MSTILHFFRQYFPLLLQNAIGALLTSNVYQTKFFSDGTLTPLVRELLGTKSACIIDINLSHVSVFTFNQMFLQATI